jgi:glycosyltransferase involved in cell wall biosynthesis
MINFIIPSVGRPTLKNTLQSLLNQSNPNWKCWVGFDGLLEDQIDKSILVDDERIHYLYLKEKKGSFTFNGNAGEVRNYLISQIDNDYKWIGFVDDDDTLTNFYVEKLIEEEKENNFDCCVFRMISGGNIIPPLHIKDQIIQGLVGISFCVNKKFLERENIGFVNSTSEDFDFLSKINDVGGFIYISDHITYNVRN